MDARLTATEYAGEKEWRIIDFGRYGTVHPGTPYFVANA